jgi:ubiquinone/menaquinone biosynthesis C-methylase UbiE
MAWTATGLVSIAGEAKGRTLFREVLRREMLDGEMTAEDRTAELRDIDRLNAWFGGHALTIREIARFRECFSGNAPRMIVDVGGGLAGLARRLVQQERSAHIIVVDRDHAALASGRATAGGQPSIHFVCADGAVLPLRRKSVDIATMSLLLHHMVPKGAVAVLREMRRVTRQGIVVNDLLRSRAALTLVWLGTRLFAKTRMARHDGPLSVRRAYEANEIREFAQMAGFARIRVRRYRCLARLIAVMS